LGPSSVIWVGHNGGDEENDHSGEDEEDAAWLVGAGTPGRDRVCELALAALAAWRRWKEESGSGVAWPGLLLTGGGSAESTIWTPLEFDADPDPDPDIVPDDTVPDTVPDTVDGKAEPDTVDGEAEPDTVDGEAEPDTVGGEAEPDTESDEGVVSREGLALEDKLVLLLRLSSQAGTVVLSKSVKFEEEFSNWFNWSR